MAMLGQAACSSAALIKISSDEAFGPPPSRIWIASARQAIRFRHRQVNQDRIEVRTVQQRASVGRPDIPQPTRFRRLGAQNCAGRLSSAQVVIA